MTWCEVHKAEAEPDRYHDDRCVESVRSGDCRFKKQPALKDALAKLFFWLVLAPLAVCLFVVILSSEADETPQERAE